MPVSAAWYDTKIQLTAGETVAITASGSVYVGALGKAKASLIYETPSGAPDYISPTKKPYLAPELAPWSLIGRIGSNGEAFAVGENATFTTTGSGELYLSINDNFFPDNAGVWNVSVQESDIATPLTTPAPAIASQANVISSPSVQIGPVMKFVDGSMQINLSGPAGTYEIDASINLMDWDLLGYLTLTSPTGQFIDTSAPNFDRRFYRAMLLK
jgi:hypothetical protein